jgi:hypothetical protein
VCPAVIQRHYKNLGFNPIGNIECTAKHGN